MGYKVSIYDGQQRPAVHPHTVTVAATLTEARREAARLLGHATLRGASTWDRYQGGTVYRFGPRCEDNGHDFAVVEEVSR